MRVRAQLTAWYDTTRSLTKVAILPPVLCSEQIFQKPTSRMLGGSVHFQTLYEAADNLVLKDRSTISRQIGPPFQQLLHRADILRTKQLQEGYNYGNIRKYFAVQASVPFRGSNVRANFILTLSNSVQSVKRTVSLLHLRECFMRRFGISRDSSIFRHCRLCLFMFSCRTDFFSRLSPTSVP
jgi:hypothetical protein